MAAGCGQKKMGGNVARNYNFQAVHHLAITKRPPEQGIAFLGHLPLLPAHFSPWLSHLALQTQRLETPSPPGISPCLSSTAKSRVGS